MLASLPARRAPAFNTGTLVVAAIAGLLLVIMAGQAAGWRQGALAAVGLLFGLTLYHASFGFTSAWRKFIRTRDGEGLRAQMVMLAVAACLFFPALSAGSLFGQPVYGFVAPVGVSVAVGAFVFGLGMQLGGGCASGTLFAVGGGSTRMVITLFFFVAGSIWATHDLPWWLSLPNVGPVSAVQSLGLWPALLLHLGVFASVYFATIAVQKRRADPRESLPPAQKQEPPSGDNAVRPPWHALLLRGPWPILAGALALAVLNFATLALAGRPWGITSAFALWGAKGLDAVGYDVTAWGYWAGSAERIAASLLLDVTSVMNFGIVIGAMLAAALAGKWAPKAKLSRGELLSAVIGGLMLGYGARLAFGCNIGAYFSGIASGSLHGWLWLVTAFAGNVIGTRLRPLFGLK